MPMFQTSSEFTRILSIVANDAFASYFGSGEDAKMSLKEVVVDLAKSLSEYKVALDGAGFSEEQAFVLCRDLQETYFQFLFMGIHHHNSHEE